MIEKLKVILMTTMMISFGILVGVSVQGIIWHLSGKSFSMDWCQLLSIVLTGVVCAIPSVLIVIAREWPKKKYIMMIVLHCVLLYAIVMTIGHIFNWFDTAAGAIAVSIEYVVVYAFVWLATLWYGMYDQKNINKALDEIRDEE